MRNVTLVFTALVALALAGCATMNVSSHIERNASFSEYVTYDWGPPDHLPVGDPRLDNNPFFNDYLQGAIEKKKWTIAMAIATATVSRRLRTTSSARSSSISSIQRPTRSCGAAGRRTP